MNNLLALLREMRGETPVPLQDALFSALTEMVNNDANYLTVQVPSNSLSKGVSLIVDAREAINIRLCYARAEMGGFMPPKVHESLTGNGWTVSGDSYGQEFAVVACTLESMDFRRVAAVIGTGLEILGVPQKTHWSLAPDYKYVF